MGLRDRKLEQTLAPVDRLHCTKVSSRPHPETMAPNHPRPPCAVGALRGEGRRAALRHHGHNYAGYMYNKIIYTIV